MAKAKVKRRHRSFPWAKHNDEPYSKPVYTLISHLDEDDIVTPAYLVPWKRTISPYSEEHEDFEGNQMRLAGRGVRGVFFNKIHNRRDR